RMAIAVARFERFGLFALIGILFLAPLLASEAGYAFNPFAEFIQPVIIAVMQALFGMVGLL
ncbi:MAG: site-2 protease family protein, partial [Rhodospirillaceae bacterium]